MKLIHKYFFAYFFIIISIFTLLHYEKEQKISNYLQHTTEGVALQYKSLYNEYKNISNVIFTTKINQQNVLELFKDAHKVDKDQKKLIRDKLFYELKSTYALLKQYNIKQLHFHLPNNDSFLRFHRPNKFGDNLTHVRSTIAYVNKHKRPIDSFEEGRIFNGYRFVFPLFYEKQHIGSVEVSFSTLVFSVDFKNNYDNATEFLTKKSVVEEKIFESEKSNYTQSPFENYLIEKSTINSIKKILKTDENFLDTNLMQETKNIVNKLTKSVSIYDSEINEVLTFIVVKNEITNKNVGLFLVKSKPTYIKNKQLNALTVFSVLFLLISLLFYFVYKNHYEKVRTNIVLKEADSGIGVMDLDGNFVEVNHVYTEVLGYSWEELLKLNCIDLSYEEDKVKSKAALKKAYKERSLSKVKKRCVAKDGSIVSLEMSLKLLPSNKEFIVVINSLEDKIKLEQLNNNLQMEVDNAVEEIRQKDMMLYKQSKTAAMGEMIDAIAHQWKSPLGIIRLYAQSSELLFQDQKNTEVNKELQEYTAKICYQVDHLLSTIEEFRSFFRVDKQPEDIPIKAVIDSVLKLMKDELIKNTIQTEIVGDTTAVVNIIPNEFKHVLINLISNSKDAFNEKDIKERKIQFIIENKGNYQILKVRDNAGGIPKNIIDKIFKPHFTTKDEEKGTGIGLYMTKQILDKSNIDIEVDNYNGGAEFVIIFKSAVSSSKKQFSSSDFYEELL